MFHFPPRRILVPVDLTPESRRAFRAARFVAEYFGARLEVIHCRPSLPAEVGAYAASALRRERLRVEAFLRRQLPGADAVHVVSGDPSTTALRLAKARRADLLVLGTHGRLGAARLLAGSVAASVMRGSRVPVLVVRGEFRAPRRVLAPLREDKDAGRGLAAAGLVARAFRAKLDVLHVVTDPIFGVDPKRLIAARVGELPAGVIRDTKPSPLVRLGRPAREIVRAARGRDLVVLVERSRSFLEDLFAGTTAERVASRSTAPVLAIPSAAR